MPKGKPYRFHPQAWHDLESADDWYRERNPEASVRFLAAIYDALDRVSRAPHRWPGHFHGTRRLILRRFPFSLIYRDEPLAISVIAVAHHKRKPGYWRHRV